MTELTKERIKICGLTRAQDVELAAELGAMALGFVFYAKSPRAVSPQTVKTITAGLGDKLWKVGVFVNADYDELTDTALQAGLTHLQLHGDESPELCTRLQSAGFQVIKALRLKQPEQLAQLRDFPAPILLDAAAPGLWGGSGHLADWDLAARAARAQPVILAGGLNPENIQTAMTTVQPWALDLSSGVESAPGIKDPTLLKALFQKARLSECKP